MVVSVICFSLNSADNKKAFGSWKVEVVNVFYEYLKSIMVISEVEGTLVVKIVLPDGSGIKVNNASLSGDVIKFTVPVEGYDVPFTGKISGNSMAGTVDSPEGKLEAKAERITLDGTWSYKAPNAPYEYSSGKIVFGEAGGKPTAKVVMPDNTLVPVANLKVSDTDFSFSIEVENETVSVSGKIVNGKIAGKALSSEGDIAFSATR